MKSWGKLLLLVIGCLLSGVLTYTQGGLASWFLLDCLLIVLLQAVLVYTVALKGLQASRSLSAPISTSGEDLVIVLHITHRSPIPLPWFIIKESWLHEGSHAKFTYRKLLFPWFRTSFTLHYRITGLMRGVYRFAGLEVVTGDLFGFAVKKAQRTDHQRCIVYPKPDALDRAVMTLHAEDGDKPAAGVPWATAPRVGGVRDYVSGDPYHRIHWKSTAKLSRLMTKAPEQASAVKRMLLLDTTPAPAATPAEAAQPLLEKGVALAAGFFAAAARGRESCGFASSSAGAGRIAPAIRPDLTLAYEVLASVGGKAALTFPDLVRKEAAALPPDASMLCITSTLDAVLLRAIAEARSRRRAVHVIYVHARPSLSVADREGASQLQALGCSFTEIPHPRNEWPKQGGVADATA
ncbi:DUF58 domain-containing protein [Paenibacillus sedimenti]|uniref:DUF58 domain-containing protein n=1 Tax=Paenibacillus sedimenti TaxID=2770274 RepID=A0A926KUL2_9BACL|nr:DUF58 domain-containing protein [Paenibacillus sedimenti]MBD0382280.1 DUF58 domain-containing protein [Paenibacillus sedimenti]